MLILTRRCGEAILVDGGIRVVVLGVDRRGVRIGIEAPRSMGIHREELVLRVAEENRRAVVLDQHSAAEFPVCLPQERRDAGSAD